MCTAGPRCRSYLSLGEKEIGLIFFLFWVVEKIPEKSETTTVRNEPWRGKSRAKKRKYQPRRQIMKVIKNQAPCVRNVDTGSVHLLLAWLALIRMIRVAGRQTKYIHPHLIRDTCSYPGDCLFAFTAHAQIFFSNLSPQRDCSLVCRSFLRWSGRTRNAHHTTLYQPILMI